ncbi:MAG: ferrous iron transport protein B [Clostridiales bacterium]|nr:ferrous iron transport protein B [Clostridiales bacterium]
MNYTFALTGNPNVGKTSLYNRLTRSSRHVGNWHGVTVDKASKKASYDQNEINIVDLPGFYSLTVYSFEEEISRDDILSGNNNLVINICEASNLPRNLYLALQLLELNVPVMIVINMMDELHKRGLTIDVKKLEKHLCIPVVSVSAKYGFNGNDLLSGAVAYAQEFKTNRVKLPYLSKLPLKKVQEIISPNLTKSGLNPIYASIKVLENDSFVIDKLELSDKQKSQLNSLGDYQATVAKLRYEFIDQITDGVIVNREGTKKTGKLNASIADNADKIMLNKWLALPIFLLIMSGIFWITFGFVGKFLTDLLDGGKDVLVTWVNGGLDSLNVPEWMNALISYGIIDGVGGVIVFLPQIVILFFFLALLEDSGYISRVAFMTDGLFRKIGLSGRAVFTMIMGLGCSATAVLTARGLEDPLMRKKTVILTPFMSCSARLPVYTAIAAAFFTSGSVAIIFGLYFLGAVTVVILAAIFQKTSLKSGESSFIMEMPKYRMPTAERVLQIIGNNAKVFIIKVGTLVFALNVIVWVLCNFSITKGFVPVGGGESIMEKISALIAPIFAPLGFGNWQAVTALMSGLVAKEVVISTITSLGGVENVFPDSLAAICFMVYTLLYVPCVATLGAVRKEVGVKWMIFGLILQLAVAYLAALAVRIIVLAFISGLLHGIIVLGAVTAATMILTAILGLMNINKRRCVRCKANCSSCK